MSRYFFERVFLLLGLASLFFAHTATAQVYYQADAMVGWTKGNPLPILLSTSPPGTAQADAGILDRGATPVFGGQAAEIGDRFGGRAKLGRWLDSSQTEAVELHWFSLSKGGSGDFFVASEAGAPILARPFFNVLTGLEDAELVSFPSLVDGTMLIESRSELHSAGFLYRRSTDRELNGRLDWLVGYRYLRFRDTLHIEENLVSTDPGGLIQVGTQIDVTDRFVTENDFHGFDLGLQWEHPVGNMQLDVVGRIAIGGVHREVDIFGQTIVTTPDPGDPVSTSEGGLLALPSNMGQRAENGLAILPQLDLNLSYPVADGLNLQVGYTVMLLTGVWRTGDQIDRGINPTQLPNSTVPFTGPARPAPATGHSTMWAQAINFGISGRF